MENLLSEFFESKTGNERKVLEELINSGIRSTNLLVDNKNEILNAVKGAKKKIVLQFISEICGQEEIIQENTENDMQPEISNIEKNRSIFEQLIAGKVRVENLVPNRLQGRFPNESLYGLSKMTTIEAQRRGSNGNDLIDLIKFQENICYNTELYIEYYNNNILEISLPLNYDDNNSLIDDFYSVLIGYVDILRNRNKKRVELISKYFGLTGNRFYSIDELVKEYNLTETTIKGNIFHTRTDADFGLYQLFTEEGINNIRVESELIHKITKIQQLGIIEDKDKLFFNGRNFDDTKLSRVLEIIKRRIIVHEKKDFLILFDEKGRNRQTL